MEIGDLGTSFKKDPHPSCYSHHDRLHHSSSSYHNYYSVPLCPPVSSAPGKQGHPQPASNTECLEKCFDPHCPVRNSLKLCDGVADCYWCVKNKDNLPLQKPYCASSERCFRGKESSITGKVKRLIFNFKRQKFLLWSTSNSGRTLTFTKL